MASSASSTFTSIQSIQRRVASRRIASRLPWVQLIFLSCAFHLCFVFATYSSAAVAASSSFAASSSTSFSSSSCWPFWPSLNVLRQLLLHYAFLSFCGLQHLLCMPHALGAPTPPLSPLNGAAHFATLMPIWCTSLSLCHAATAATAASCCCYSKKRSQALASLVSNSSSSTPFPFPSLLLPHLSRVE